MPLDWKDSYHQSNIVISKSSLKVDHSMESFNVTSHGKKRLPMSIISVDATDCYDRVHHIIMALVFLSLGVKTGAIAAMLQSIQLMKFFSPYWMG